MLANMPYYKTYELHMTKLQGIPFLYSYS